MESTTSRIRSAGALLACLLVGSCAAERSVGRLDRPPVILVSFDTCRTDVFGTLTGKEPSPTPRLDEFAADSVVFENAYVSIPHTLPSHMSLMTSVQPDVHGVMPDDSSLPDALVTLAEVLSGVGYHTVGIVTSEWLKPVFGFGRGFDHYERLRHRPTYADRVNAEALRRLDGGDRPTFLFLHYYDLHSDFEQGRRGNKLPYYSAPRYRQGLGVSLDGAEFCDQDGKCNTRFLMEADRQRRHLPRKTIDTIHALYRAAVPQLDEEMGTFFDDLRRRGLYDRSLIVVTADHGEEFREHGRFIHSQPYDETARVPLFIKLPGSRKAGTRVLSVVQLLDVMPTILEVVGVPIPDQAQGVSLTDLIDDPAGPGHGVALSQDSISWSRYGLRIGDMKLVMDLKSTRGELYDLCDDPLETIDLAPMRPDTADRMEAELRKTVESNRRRGKALRTGATAQDDLLTSEERRRLEALGYGS
jgi:arylsulfatase A-like enzyme